MQLKQFGCVLITKDDKLAGILTERDIIAKALGEDVHFGEILVDDVITPNPESFKPEDSIAFATERDVRRRVPSYAGRGSTTIFHWRLSL